MSKNALRTIINDEGHQAVPYEHTLLPRESAIAAIDLPAERQLFGGDVSWAATFAAMSDDRRVGSDKSLA